MMGDWLSAWDSGSFGTLDVTAVGERFLGHVSLTDIGLPAADLDHSLARAA